MRKPPSRPTILLRRTAAGLGLVLASLLAAGALLELGVRLFAPSVREHALPRELVSADDLLGWRLAPSRVAQHHSQYFDIAYATNALGYRDRPRSPSDPTAYRLLLFGDSQIFGWGLPAEQRFSDLIERGSDGLEVWNLAVPGYGLDQQVLSYERDAAPWRADGVIFFVSQFTLERLHEDYIFGYNKPAFRPGAGQDLEVRWPGGRVPRSLLFAVPRWMYTPYFVDHLLARADHRWRSGRGVPRERSSELLAGVLGLAARLGKERGQSVFVLSTQSSKDERPLRQMCARLAIRYLTVGIPAGEPDLVFGPYDAHWNANANRWLSRSLGRQLAAVSGEASQGVSSPGPGPAAGPAGGGRAR